MTKKQAISLVSEKIDDFIYDIMEDERLSDAIEYSIEEELIGDGEYSEDEYLEIFENWEESEYEYMDLIDILSTVNVVKKALNEIMYDIADKLNIEEDY